MNFIYDGKDYQGKTATEIVRGLERDAPFYPHQGGALRDFMRWSLTRFADRIHTRELDLSERLADETLAFSYLYLLDEYGIGHLVRVCKPQKFGKLSI